MIKDFSSIEVVSPKYAERTQQPSLQIFTQQYSQPQKLWLTLAGYIPLLCCLLLAVIIRAWLVIHTNGFIDGDEAVVGIQAEHILHGEFPVYFYNQPYMGSLEAYLMAVLFAIAGPSVWTLRAEPILLSLVVVYLTWKFAGMLAEAAQLPVYIRQCFMNVSAFLAALPPLYDTVVELRTLGGYIEIFVLMLLLLISALQLTRRRQKGASTSELTLRWAGIGLIVGLGFWVNPLIISAVIAAGLWILWDWIQSLRFARKRKQTQLVFSSVGVSLAGMQSLAGVRKARPYSLFSAAASIPACLLGAAPAIIWGINNSWQNVTYMLDLAGTQHLRPEIIAQYPTRLSILFGLIQLYTNCVGPHLLSGALPLGDSQFLPLQMPMLLLNLAGIAVTTFLILLSFVVHRPFFLQIRRLAALPLLFGACTAIIFCTTQTAASGLWLCKYDMAGRYAAPLMLVLPFFFATLFTSAVLMEVYFHRKDDRQFRSASYTYYSSHTRRSLLSAITPGFRTQRAIQLLLLIFLTFSFYTQIAGYWFSNPLTTFQSPYCYFAPADNDPIIAYMEREHIYYVWADNWIGDSITFKTNGNIIASDPLPILGDKPILDRIPTYTQAVEHADRASMLVFVFHNDPHPILLQYLDKQHVTYRSARFPAQAGYDVLLVTPLSRTVSPFESERKIIDFYAVFLCYEQ